ncbi:hypothetical protein [Micromonospora thermarum]|uniref:C2H2-type domain-containing protein n=1 Tax=Micromonospora thermarum TaxID=2720024 RepID=A0ABX0Z8F9_9ACTN|nr:hypothetical protein [Micromonospora thermarum]NJP33763.1 hypothetical protein [Micromonospora thermarum]
MSNEPVGCLKCGALVENAAQHRRWHEALERVAPGVEAEVRRIREQRGGSPA